MRKFYHRPANLIQAFTLALTFQLPSAAAQDFILVPEGDQQILCTLDGGCTEAGKLLGYETRQRLRGQSTMLSVARSMLQERAEQTWAYVRSLSPREMLTNELARAVVRNSQRPTSHDATWAAREHVFAVHLCGIFEHFPNPEQACSIARGSTNRFAESRGLPEEVLPFIRNAEQSLYTLGRRYLSRPDNLWRLYEDIKPAILDEYSNLIFGGQQDFQAVLRLAQQALLAYDTDAVQTALLNFYALEENRADMDWETFIEQVEAANTELDRLAGDHEFARFWHRRDSEGGSELLEVYEGILSDLLEEISTPLCELPLDGSVATCSSSHN